MPTTPARHAALRAVRIASVLVACVAVVAGAMLIGDRLAADPRVAIALGVIVVSAAVIAGLLARLPHDRTLSESQKAYQVLFENAPIGIYRTTPAGEIAIVNPTLLAMLGYESVEDLREHDLERDGPHASYSRAEFKRLLGERGEVHGLESVWRRRDGSLIQVSENARAVRDSAGEVLFYEGTVEDVTERKVYEEELRASRERFRHIVDNANDIIYRTDAEGHFTFVNPTASKVMGYPQEELVGKMYLELIDPEYQATAAEFYGNQFRNRSANTYFEFPAIAKDGRRLWIGQNVQALRDGDRIVGFQAVARDISDRKRIESELAAARDAALESARIRSEFLANMSHEIRTPMNGVIGMTRLLLNSEMSADQREYAEAIRSSAESLLAIVNDVLDLSKIESGMMTIESADFDLDELVESVTDVFLERAVRKRLKFHAIIYPDVQRRLRGDAGRVRQVLVNLVGNAIKFTDSGEVTLSVQQKEHDGDGYTLSFIVSDTGIGITDDAQERLFNAFVQADGTTTRKYGGTGLGLAISKDLVAMMGGEIGVASHAGEGSTFWFTVPFLAPLERPAPSKMKPVVDGRVLVVDESDVARLVLRRQISSCATHIDEARSAEEAVAALRREAIAGQPFAVIVTEMQMRAMDGLALTRAIRGDALIRETAVVLVTSIGRRRSDIESFASAGIDSFVVKPYRRTQLVDAIAAAARKHGRHAPVLPGPRTIPIRKPAHSRRILVVEDNPVNQIVAVGQLRELGYAADVAENGRQALVAIESTVYDLVLMDCQMPEMDGYEATREIRRIEGGRVHVPIVAMTAHAMAGEREKCIEAGMDDYVAKPVSDRELTQTLARWLGPSPVARPDDGHEVIDPKRLAYFRKTDESMPGFFRNVVAAFRNDVPERLEAMRTALAAQDHEAFARAAHALKSSSGNIGAKFVHGLCADAEGLVRDGKPEIAGALLPRIEAETERALAALGEGR